MYPIREPLISRRSREAGEGVGQIAPRKDAKDGRRWRVAANEQFAAVLAIMQQLVSRRISLHGRPG
jgi:uncharacterized membrane protein